MRRARLKITPNLSSNRKKPECSEETPKIPPAPVEEEEEEKEKENTLVETEPPTVVTDSEHSRSKRAGFVKSKFKPNLSPSRKRTLSSSSTGSTRTRTISSGSSQDIPEVPVFDQRKADHKKKFHRGVPERSKLTVFDFIFHNPLDGSRMSSRRSSTTSISRDEDEPAPVEEEITESAPQEEEAEEERDTSMPVPQVKIGPDGQIVLDEDSTFIETTATKKAKEDLLKTPLIFENQSTNYGTWGKKRKNVEWSEKETLRFYKALTVFGTDFSMMASIFKKRSRHDLKMKFKKEERGNRHLVDRCLNQNGQFDLSTIGSESEDDISQDHKSRKKKPTRKRAPSKKVNVLPKKRRSKPLKSSRRYYSSSDNEDEVLDIPSSGEKSPPSTPTIESVEDVTLPLIEAIPPIHGINKFPPGLLAANPALASATSGSLVVVASPANAQQSLHVYTVDESHNERNSEAEERTLLSAEESTSVENEM